MSTFFVIKLSAIVICSIITAYLIFRRMRSKRKYKNELKHNISLLREEKLLTHADKKLQKKRQKLIKKTLLPDDAQQKQLLSKSKKTGIPAGELLLAAKIQTSIKKN